MKKSMMQEIAESNGWEDHYPPERIEYVKERNHRNSTVLFINMYHRYIQERLYVPRHWHEFAADILHRAATLADTNDKARAGILAKEMGLQGKKGNAWRDLSITLAIQQAIILGEYANPTQAQKNIANKMCMTEDAIRKIWDARGKDVAYMAANLSDIDFLEQAKRE